MFAVKPGLAESRPTQVTHGHLLNGRLHYTQPVVGYRTGIEPVLLAASVPAHAGERVLEGGTGAGAGLMCLAARVPGLTGVGVEIDPATAELARHNIRANELNGLHIVTADVSHAPEAQFHHAFANPPWHDPMSTPSPVARRQLAKQGNGPGLEGWISALRRTLLPGGSLTLILPATLAPRAVGAMRACGLNSLVQTPLLPRPDRPAKLTIIGARLGRDRPDRVNPPIVLHEDGSYTREIEAVLRNGAALPLTPSE